MNTMTFRERLELSEPTSDRSICHRSKPRQVARALARTLSSPYRVRILRCGIEILGVSEAGCDSSVERRRNAEKYLKICS